MGIFWFLSGLKHSPRWEWLCKIISVNMHTRSSKMENCNLVQRHDPCYICSNTRYKTERPVTILGYILYFTFPHIWSLSNVRLRVTEVVKHYLVPRCFLQHFWFSTLAVTKKPKHFSPSLQLNRKCWESSCRALWIFWFSHILPPNRMLSSYSYYCDA